MQSFDNARVLATGWHISSQTPIDDRLVMLNYTDILSLGPNNEDAYRYYDGLKIFVVENESEYVWKESNTGILPQSFTYPANISLNGVNYSNRSFNLVQSSFPPSITDINVFTTAPLASATYTNVNGASPYFPARKAVITSNNISAFPTLQGVAPYLGIKVLVKDQVNKAQNGDYILTKLGNGTTEGWELTRISYRRDGFYPRFWMIKDGPEAHKIFTQFNAELNTATIGVTGDILFGLINQSIDTITVTHTELINLINSSGLIPQASYTITDFQTIYDQPDYDANKNPKTPVVKTGPVRPIAVVASSVNTLNLEAYDLANPKDIIKYIPEFTTPVSNTVTKGRIIQRIDNFGNETDYDHRIVLYKRYYDVSTGDFVIYWDNGNGSIEVFTFISNFTAENDGTRCRNNFIQGPYTAVASMETFTFPYQTHAGSTIVFDLPNVVFRSFLSESNKLESISSNVTFSNDSYANNILGECTNCTFALEMRGNLITDRAVECVIKGGLMTNNKLGLLSFVNLRVTAFRDNVIGILSNPGSIVNGQFLEVFKGRIESNTLTYLIGFKTVNNFNGRIQSNIGLEWENIDFGSNNGYDIVDITNVSQIPSGNSGPISTAYRLKAELDTVGDYIGDDFIYTIYDRDGNELPYNALGGVIFIAGNTINDIQSMTVIDSTYIRYNNFQTINNCDFRNGNFTSNKGIYFSNNNVGSCFFNDFGPSFNDNEVGDNFGYETNFIKKDNSTEFSGNLTGNIITSDCNGCVIGNSVTGNTFGTSMYIVKVPDNFQNNKLEYSCMGRDTPLVYWDLENYPEVCKPFAVTITSKYEPIDNTNTPPLLDLGNYGNSNGLRFYTDTDELNNPRWWLVTLAETSAFPFMFNAYTLVGTTSSSIGQAKSNNEKIFVADEKSPFGLIGNFKKNHSTDVSKLYVPTLNDLLAIYNAGLVTNFTGIYWSSTEVNATTAYAVNFATGAVIQASKETKYPTRLVTNITHYIKGILKYVDDYGAVVTKSLN
jgi:hypothetical protein